MLLRKRAEEMVELMEKTKAELTSSNENINGEVYIRMRGNRCNFLFGTGRPESAEKTSSDSLSYLQWRC